MTDWATATEAAKAIAERVAIASVLNRPGFFIVVSSLFSSLFLTFSLIDVLADSLWGFLLSFSLEVSRCFWGFSRCLWVFWKPLRHSGSFPPAAETFGCGSSA